MRLAGASLLVLTLVLTTRAPAAEVPQTVISNGVVKARVYLPDAERGYYRGVRFDWAGVVASLTYQGHEFFGQWFQKYDPLLHDAIMGPVEEFRGEDGALDYAETKPNHLFMKIGVGLLRKLYDEPYNFASTYPLIVPGSRVVRASGDRVEFEHQLNNGEGYAYDYHKTLRLTRSKPELVLEHSLKNTGTRVIETSVYDHDFYMLDHHTTGPEFRVRFRFKPESKDKDQLQAPGRIEGNEIRYDRELGPQPDSVHGYITGFDDSIADNDIRVENTKAGIGVRETGNQPISKLYFWSIHTTVCPEAYIKILVAPGQTFKWRTSYDFYLLN
jgi:hypothetical protein